MNMAPELNRDLFGKGDEYEPLPLKSDDTNGSRIKNQVCQGGNNNWIKKIMKENVGC